MSPMDAALERRIRDAYAAFTRGDIDAMLEGFLPDATMTNPEYAIDGGVRQGRDDLRAGFEALHDQFDYTDLRVEQLIEGPAGVLVMARMIVSGKGSGAPLDERFAHVFRLRDGQVVDFAWFRTEAEGRRAVGL